MGEPSYDTERKNKTLSLVFSILVHVLIISLFLLSPLFSHKLPPKGQEGIMVVFGDSNEGMENEIEKNVQKPQEKIIEQQPEEKAVEKKATNIQKTPVDEKEKIAISESKNKKTSKQEEVKNETQTKEDFSKLFKNKGNSNKSGNQGDPLGSMDSQILEGISKGKGKVGDGLDDRGILYEPKFEDNSQKSGIVVIRLCVNNNGEVISAKYTQRGSTTTDSHLIQIAENNAKKYKFAPSELKEQCGNVSISFIVK
ncbi:MAG: cell envelope integrity protein TolA [Saprospiraceae bacterium]